MSANPNFATLASTTLKNYRKQFVSDVTNHIPFFYMMKEEGSVVEDGGEKIVRQIGTQFAPAQSYAAGDQVTVSFTDFGSAAEYNWKNILVNAVVRNPDLAMNSGKEKIISIMDATIKNAEQSMEDKIADMFFGDGTGNSGKDILGLEAIIAQDPTNDSLGDIPSASNSFWQNYTNTSVGSFASGGISAIQTAINQTTRGKSRTNLIVTGPTIFGYMQKIANSSLQIQTDSKYANLGFDVLRINSIKVIFDSKCPADRVYGLNLDNIEFVINKNVNFTVGNFIEPIDYDWMAAKIKLQAQLVCDRRDTQWVLSGFSA